MATKKKTKVYGAGSTANRLLKKRNPSPAKWVGIHVTEFVVFQEEVRKSIEELTINLGETQKEIELLSRENKSLHEHIRRLAEATGATFWKSADGPFRVRDMSDGHIKNALNMIHRRHGLNIMKSAAFSDPSVLKPSLSSSIRALINEAKRRNIQWDIPTYTDSP